MLNNISELFQDEQIVQKIKDKLPKIFLLAEMESQRAGKIGMEVGTLRERILVSLLVYRFGKENVKTEIPITEPEEDVRVFDKPISIKTKTGTGFSGVELIWTVDAQKSKKFRENYYPRCDILLLQINWNDVGGFYCIPLEVQKRLFDGIGRQNWK
jgi:hypothetical protein